MKTLNIGDIVARIFTGKYGEYRYLSPRCGYLYASLYNKIVYLYLTGNYERGLGYFDTLYFKNKSNVFIANYIENYKETSRLYKKAIINNAGSTRGNTQAL